MRILSFVFIAFPVCWITVSAQHLKIDSLEQQLNRADDTVRVNVLLQLADLYRNIQIKKSDSLNSMASTLSHQLNYKKGIYRGLMIEHQNCRRGGIYSECFVVIKKAIEMAQDLKSPRLIAESKNELAWSYLYLNQHNKALEVALDALEASKTSGDKNLIASVINTIGSIYSEGLQDYEKAQQYFQNAAAIYSEINYKHGVGFTSINVGLAYQKMEDYDKAIEYFNRALQIEEALNNMYFISYIIGIKARVHHDKGDFKRAVMEYHSALRYAEKLEKSNLSQYWLIGLGEAYLQTGDYALARNSFTGAAALADPKDYSTLIKINSGLASTYDNLKDFEHSNEVRQFLIIAQDSLAANQQKDKLRELQARYQADEYEKQIADLNKKKRTNTLLIILLVCLLAAVAAMAYLVISRQRLRHQSQKKLAEQESLWFKSELANKDLAEKQLKIDLEYKSRELTSQALAIIQKNELIDEIRKDITEICKASTEETPHKLNRLLTTLNFSERIDKDWHNFKVYFEQVHKGFFDNLTATYPDLNAKELKLCALLRLNMDTKQIATIMDISPESAKVARHRIRKKLGLVGEDNLSVFFNKIG